MPLLDHSSHWKEWKRLNTESDLVVCNKDYHRLYYGKAPTSSEDVLKLDLYQLTISESYSSSYTNEGQDEMPTRTPPPNDGHPSMRVVEDHEIPNEHDSEGNTLPMDTGPESHKLIPSVQSIPQPGSQVALKTTYSRTIAEPGVAFGSQTASFELTEVYPGEMTAEDIVDIAKEQYQALKSTVLQELGLPFNQDEATGRIMEAFPGSTVVATTASTPPRVAAQSRQAAPAPARPATAAPQRQQASRTAPSAPRVAFPVTPSRAELWQELLDFPNLWFWQTPESKTNPNQPDYLSMQYKNDRGGPVGLWETYEGRPVCPDVEALNAIGAEDFSQQRP